MTEPREFSCMDDSPFNNGWGYNSEPRYIPEEKEEEEIDPDYPDEKENTITVLDKGNWGVSNTEK